MNVGNARIAKKYECFRRKNNEKHDKFGMVVKSKYLNAWVFLIEKINVLDRLKQVFLS
jgi:hypothetical protein